MATKTQKSVRTLDDFRAAHDKNVIIPNKIRAALDEMLKEGQENWAYEAEFIRRAGVSQTDMGLFRDQFSDHVVEAKNDRGKRIWFACVKVAEKVR